MIVVVRMRGIPSLERTKVETLERLRLRKKLVCTFIDENNKAELGMLRKVQSEVFFDKVSDELAKKIIEKRGRYEGDKLVKKEDAEKILEGIKKGEWKIKKFFRLHPPIGGFKRSTKLAWSNKGVLGHNKDAAKLIERML
jgi:large subunit ribosomal protein L30